MKILEKGALKWIQRVKCGSCSAELEIDEDDLFIDNRSQGCEKVIVVCLYCKAGVFVACTQDVPDHILTMLRTEKRDYDAYLNQRRNRN